MPSETWVDFKTVKAAVSMEMVLQRYGLLDKLTVKGDRLVGLCPIHHKGADQGESNSQQFSVSLSKNAFKCFAGSCGKKGNQIDLVAALEGVPFREAAVKLVEWFSVKSQRPTEAEVKPAPGAAPTSETPSENTPLTFELKLDAAHPYLAGRGLTPETVAHFGLGISGRGSMKGRACIPIHDHAGNLVAYAGRWAGTDATIPQGEGKYKLPAGFHKGRCVCGRSRVPVPMRVQRHPWQQSHEHRGTPTDATQLPSFEVDGAPASTPHRGDGPLPRILLISCVEPCKGQPGRGASRRFRGAKDGARWTSDTLRRLTWIIAFILCGSASGSYRDEDYI